MAKRYQAPRDFSRSFKKPKLDISINKGRPVQKSRSADVPRTTLSSPNKDFWDDGDDDVLLLATQVAETAVNNKRTECSFAITETELTFSEFMPNVAGSSTQRPDPEINVPNQDILSQIFEDDFEWGVDGDAKKGENSNIKKPHISDYSKEEEILFKKPSLPFTNKPHQTGSLEEIKKPHEIPVSKSKSQGSNLMSVSKTSALNTEPEPEILSQSAARRQLASERQIKFLMDRLDIMKKENQKLASDLEDNKSKITCKEGEISLLRDELKHTKQQMQNLKMERILTADAAKSECRTKIAQLSTQVEAKKTEAQLKALECMQLKLRHAEETQRFEMSMRNDSILLEDLPQDSTDGRKKPPTNFYIEREVLRIRSTDRFQSKKDPLFVLNFYDKYSKKDQIRFLYNETEEETNVRGISDQVIANQWQILRIAAVNLQVTAEKQNLSKLETKEYAKNFSTALVWILNELNNLSENLIVKNCRVYSWYRYNSLDDFSHREKQSLLQGSSLYPSESAIELRRCIAVISFLTRHHSFLVKEMFSKITESCNVEGEFPLPAASKRLCRIGFSTELVEHLGIIEAFATLVHSLLIQAIRASEQNKSFPEEWQSHITILLKEIIFCRPSPRILSEISFCILLCTKLPYCLSLLCQNSPSASFRAEPVRSLCEFNQNSCILQVYCSLLEVCFPLHTPLPLNNFNLLTVISLNHIRFVYFCFTKPPKFVHDRLPCYDDDDEDEDMNQVNGNETSSSTNMYTSSSSSASTINNSSNNSNNITQQNQQKEKPTNGPLTCECYHRLSISVVTLGYQVLRHWTLSDKTFCKKRVSQIAKILIQLLHIIFCDNYLTTLFRNFEDTTKHFLHLVSKWISENTEIFQFESFHLNLLEKLKNSHVMPKSLKDEENLGNLAADLADWCRITNNKVDLNSKRKKTNNLLDDSTDKESFFEGLKGYAYNFQ